MIRVAAPADAALLARIQEEASLAGLAHVYPPELYPFPTDAVTSRWHAFDGWAAIAEVDGAPAGFAAVAPPWLEALYVLPAAWGTRLAGELHAAAVAALTAAAVERARLWVLEENRRARRFYERLGWAADGTTRVVPFPPHPLDLGYALQLRGSDE